MAWTQLSIRKSLIGDIFDFVKDSGFGSSSAAEIVADLAFYLSEYREEDIPLFPDVYIVERTHEANVLSSLAPGCERIPIGTTPISHCGAKCLKDCAPLAERGWAIFLAIDDKQAQYGLFRAFDLPVAVTASESLTDHDSEAGAVILIRNCASKCVELIDGTGQHLELSLTPVSPSSQAVSTHLRSLAQIIVQDTSPDDREALQGYFERVLTESIRSSHGALVAVVQSDLTSLPAEFSEYVALSSPLGFEEAFRSLRISRDATSLSLLQARETLLSGMIASDGVTILGTNATLRAFRLFVRPTEAESKAMASVRGGGRTRAFEVLKSRIGAPFVAAFFRSQDGRTEFVGGPK